MNPILQMLLNGVLKYLEDHPEQAEEAGKAIAALLLQWIAGLNKKPA